ncbi:MAG: hypothetical protein U0800_16425 [Isosphaeraceae bacterium]
MTLAIALLSIAALADDSAADSLTLRDGRVLRGQVAEQAPNGQSKMVIRREWAEAKLPDLFSRWKKAEAGTLGAARKQRRERLAAWKDERSRSEEKGDFVCDWIDAELKRLAKPFDPAEAPLMVITLNRGEVKSAVRRKEPERRMLRQAWIEGLENPEELAVEDLRSALRKARVSGIGDDPAPIEELLPDPPENDNQWRLRRAATEVSYDNGLRFVRYETLVLPEGQEMAPQDAQKALGGLLGNLLGEPNAPQTDPLMEKLRAVEGRGKVGVVITRLDLGPQTGIESTLWVRTAREGWRPALVQKVEARADQVPEKAGEPLAEDPQVKAAFGLLEGLGLGNLGEDAKRLSLRSGASVQKALGEARIALENNLKELALPVRGSIRPRLAEDP